MKRIFTILSFCLPLFAFGQGIELNPSEDIYQEYSVNDWSGDKVDIKNVSGSAMTINYETLSNTFLDDWGCTFCAGVDCFNHIPTTGTIGELADGGVSFLTVSLGFGEYVGEGTVVFKIYDANDETVADTISITYKVEEISGTNDLVNDYNFSLSPNPTTGDLLMKNDQLDNFRVSVYSLTGQLILDEKVTGKTWNGNLSNQSPGFYLVTVQGENGLVFREKISKI